jgi:uncharacterized protein (TIGR02172 family)
VLLGKVIGRGRTADVLDIRDKDKKVIKLFHEKMPFDYIEKEYEISRLINTLGIPSPNAEAFLKSENKWGIVYEKIIGRNFTQVISSQPLLLKKNAIIFAKIQASFHTKSTDKLASQKEYLSRKISETNLLSIEEKDEIINYLKQLPDDNKICHGDYHTDNIILKDGKPMVLDWLTGTSGNPCGDVARTLILIRFAYLPQDLPKTTKLLIQSGRKAFAKFYLSSYIKLTNISAESIEKWLLPVMAARLVESESIHESETQLLLKELRFKLQKP